MRGWATLVCLHTVWIAVIFASQRAQAATDCAAFEDGRMPGLSSVGTGAVEDGPMTVASESIADGTIPMASRQAEPLYAETYRPQFHFTAKENWLNDPNGLVYYDGEYHLFFQHNQEGLQWGPMTWGHAVSTDLVHWEQLAHALEPGELGIICSGSAVVDWSDTAGFRSGDLPPIVAIYTACDDEGRPQEACVQCIAYSNDRGRTWAKYDGNPVLGHIVANNRDPRVFWHVPTRRWVMALYLDASDFALFASPDLKEWTKLQDIVMRDTIECPDLFPLPVDGDPDNVKWVFWGANGNYMIGTFDGQTFQREGEILSADAGANFAAAQTWNDIPASDGRRIQIAWMGSGVYPNMPFNQQMTFPCELSLRTTPDGLRLSRYPVGEIEALAVERHSWSGATLRPGDDPLDGIDHDLLDIRAEIDLGTARSILFTLRGEPVRYSFSEQHLFCSRTSAPLRLVDGRVELRILLDRTSIEVFGNRGLVSMTSCFVPEPDDRTVSLEAIGGTATVVEMHVTELRSAWN